MGRSIIMHVDDAPWIKGEASARDAIKKHTEKRGTQMIGDREKGPWIHIHHIEPDKVVPPHSHDVDEVLYILEGEVTLGDRLCGPGTVLFIKQDTEYGFTVGDHGVRFMAVRPGQVGTKFAGEESYVVRTYAPAP